MKIEAAPIPADEKVIGGFRYKVIEDGKEIGNTDVWFHKRKYVYPDGDSIAGNRGIVGTIEIDESYRNKGIGSKLLRRAEQDTSKAGLRFMEVPSVDNPQFFFKKGYHHAYSRVFIKDLKRRITSGQRKRTARYIRIYAPHSYRDYEEPPKEILERFKQ